MAWTIDTKGHKFDASGGGNFNADDWSDMSGWSDSALKRFLSLLSHSYRRLSHWEQGFAANVAMQTKALSDRQRLYAEALCVGVCVEPRLETLPFFVCDRRDSRAECSGIYWLVSSDKVIYVGQSVNVGQRITQHWCKGRQFSFVWIQPCKRESLLRSLERVLIHLYRPIENVDHNHGYYSESDAEADRWDIDLFPSEHMRRRLHKLLAKQLLGREAAIPLCGLRRIDANQQMSSVIVTFPRSLGKRPLLKEIRTLYLAIRSGNSRRLAFKAFP